MTIKDLWLKVSIPATELLSQLNQMQLEQECFQKPQIVEQFLEYLGQKMEDN